MGDAWPEGSRDFGYVARIYANRFMPGIPLIYNFHPVRFDKAHFDIKQLHCIQWHSAAQLRDKVSARTV